jgi:hypothetical protein
MEIGSLHQASTTAHQRGVAKSGSPRQENAAPENTDSVVISDRAREQLARLADRALAEADFSATTATEDAADEDVRIEKIMLAKARIQAGYYNQPEVREQLADRLADELIDQPPENPETSE